MKISLFQQEKPVVCMLPSVSAVSPVGKRRSRNEEREDEENFSSQDVASWVLVGQQFWPPLSQGR